MFLHAAGLQRSGNSLLRQPSSWKYLWLMWMCEGTSITACNLNCIYYLYYCFVSILHCIWNISDGVCIVYLCCAWRSQRHIFTEVENKVILIEYESQFNQTWSTWTERTWTERSSTCTALKGNTLLHHPFVLYNVWLFYGSWFKNSTHKLFIELTMAFSEEATVILFTSLWYNSFHCYLNPVS